MSANPKQNLLPQELQIPPLYSQENNPDPLAVAKLFDPCSSWSWYVIEYNPEGDLAFGYVEGFENELGYFSISELESITRTPVREGNEITLRVTRPGEPPGPIGIERDLDFKPTPMSKICPRLYPLKLDHQQEPEQEQQQVKSLKKEPSYER